MFHSICTFYFQLHRRHKESGGFRPTAFRKEAAHLTQGENVFAFQYCKIPSSDKSIIHFEFMGCIAESDAEDDTLELEIRSKRGENECIFPHCVENIIITVESLVVISNIK